MGFYTLADGRKVEFTDGDVLRDVADLWAIVRGEFKGTESSASAVLKGMMGAMQSGKPLDADQWVLLQRFRRRYSQKLVDFRKSNDSEFEGFVPVPPAGAGRITEVMKTLPPSARFRIREGYKTESTTTKDRNTTAPHLLDTVMHDLAHARQHLDRLSDADVKGNPKSISFNAEHAMTHLDSAVDHASRLGKHLGQYASNPKTFTVERSVLAKLKEAAVGKPRQHTVCVDFDGVIHQGPHGLPGKVEGTPILGANAALQKLHKLCKVVCLTARTDFKAVEDWLQANGLSNYVDEVTNVKPPAMAYIDDRAVHFTNWEDALQAVNPLDSTPLDGRGSVLHESAPPKPPNLRVATDERESCGTCKMFNDGLCWGYANYPVNVGLLCDSWDRDPRLEPEPTIDMVKAAQDPAILLNLSAAGYGRRR